ncbi:hypothetical protein ACQKM2_40655 [Streptomyces sp. NPDC004126]|uniref:hypothetical protein n=1 Tax=Streptomyces sp. NPDC004126 TaxID=3390695 RepID=UPI003D08E87E
MTTSEENTSTTTVEEPRRQMALPVGIVRVCGTCRQQGHIVHPSVDAARHDAGRHALAPVAQLSRVQEGLLCGVLGCDPQARHRRRRAA